MKRLVFIVEGDCEVQFVHNHVMPYLYSLGYQNTMNAQAITTNRKLNQKGGGNNYEYLKNEINRILAQPNTIVTTFIDFFKLPTNTPKYSADVHQIDTIEEAISENIGSSFLIPYIQKHEFEALLFADMAGFELVVDDNSSIQQLQQIIDDYPNPEDINNNPATAPSKRLQQIFNYHKVSDSDLIADMIGLQKIIEKCPRFAQWLETIREKLDLFNTQ